MRVNTKQKYITQHRFQDSVQNVTSSIIDNLWITFAIAILAILFTIFAQIVLSGIDHRVCNTASPQEYINLHCSEVK